MALRSRESPAGRRLRHGRRSRARLEACERCARDANGLHGAADEEAGHEQRDDGDCRADQRMVPNALPDFVNLVSRIGYDDNELGPAIAQTNRDRGNLGWRMDKRAKPLRRIRLTVLCADDRQGEQRFPRVPARTCLRFWRLAISASTASGSGGPRKRPSEVETNSFVRRIALSVSARTRALASKTAWPASTMSQSANSEAKMRLSRVRREVERHIVSTPFRRHR